MTEVADELRAGSVNGIDLGRVQVGIPVGADHIAVVQHVVPLAVVGGDDTDAVKGLGQVGQDVGNPVADPVIPVFGPLAEPEREHCQRRDDQQDGDQGQLDIQRQHDARDHDHRESLHRELRQPVLEQLLQVFDVAGHTAHDHARLLLGVEVERQSLQVGKDLHSQVVHDPRRQPSGDLGHEALSDRGNGHGDQIEDRDHDDDAHVLFGPEAPVDPDTDQRRAGLVEDADDGDQRRRQQPQLPVLEQQRPKGQLLGLVAGLAVAEGDGWVGVLRLVGQEPVDAILQLGRNAGKGQPTAGVPW